jgi:membrane-associated phospholipid phosphatase
MPTVLKPVDLLSIVFLFLLQAVTFAALPSLPHWAWLTARICALILALWLTAWCAANRTAPRWVITFHAFLPVLVVPVIFDSLGDLIPWLWPRYLDNLLIRADRLLFCGHDPTVLLEPFIHPELTTVLQIAYISYYPMAAVLGVVLFAKRKQGGFDEAIFGIVLCFYLSYLGYLLFPAIGPRFTLAHLQTGDLQAGPFVVKVQNALNRLENTKTDAFPSGHTAVALMTLYYAWKTREKVLTALLIPAVTGLIVSTVYLRYHYVIDVIAGIALALLTIKLAPPLFRRALRVTGRTSDQFHRPS